MAKPNHGTTATQAACLFQVLGSEQARNFYRGLRDNGIRSSPATSRWPKASGHGEFAVGLTDTDDAIIEVEAGQPVVILYPDRDRPTDDHMGTLFIPNTVAVVRGQSQPRGGRASWSITS